MSKSIDALFAIGEHFEGWDHDDAGCPQDDTCQCPNILKLEADFRTVRLALEAHPALADRVATLERELAEARATIDAWNRAGRMEAREIVDRYCESWVAASEDERQRLADHIQPAIAQWRNKWLAESDNHGRAIDRAMSAESARDQAQSDLAQARAELEAVRKDAARAWAAHDKVTQSGMALQARLSRLEAVVRTLEWSGEHPTLECPCCPDCGVPSHYGTHSTDCALAAALGEVG